MTTTTPVRIWLQKCLGTARGRNTRNVADPYQTGTVADSDQIKIGDFRITLSVATSFDEVRRDWQEFQKTAAGYPFQACEWLSTWQSQIGEPRGMELFIVFGRDQAGRTRIIFPLGIENRLTSRRIVWLGHPVSDYNAPMVCPDLLSALTPVGARKLWHCVFDLAGGADYAYLTKQPASLGSQSNPFNVISTHDFSVGAHAACLGSDWEQYYASRRGTKTRRRLREKERRLAKLGTVELQACTTSTEKHETIQFILSLKSEQLSQNGDRNLIGAHDVGQFYETLCLHHGADLNVHLFALRVGGEIVAATFGIVRDGCFFYLMPVNRNGRYRNCSPGTILLVKLLEWSIKNGLDTFDFTIGDEGYKLDWSDRSQAIRFAAVPFNLKGRLLGLAVANAIQLKKQIKQSPLLLKMVRLVLGARNIARAGPKRPAGTSSPATPPNSVRRPNHVA